jgi:hypothetical protein
MKQSFCVIPGPVFVLTIGMMLAAVCLMSEPLGQGRNQSAPLTSGTLTPEQVEDVHAGLYFNSLVQLDKNGHPVPEIPRLLSSTSGDIYLNNIVASGRPISADPSTNFALFACYYDLVALGTAGTGTTHITKDKSFLYTDWGFSVERVFKNNSIAPVQVGSSVTVVAPGGNLQVSGRMVHAYDGRFPPLASGQQYIMVFEFVPKTGAYQPAGAYAISGEKIAGHGTMMDPVDTRGLDSSTLLKLVEGAATAATQMSNCKGAAKK